MYILPLRADYVSGGGAWRLGKGWYSIKPFVNPAIRHPKGVGLVGAELVGVEVASLSAPISGSKFSMSSISQVLEAIDMSEKYSSSSLSVAVLEIRGSTRSPLFSRCDKYMAVMTIVIIFRISMVSILTSVCV